MSDPAFKPADTVLVIGIEATCPCCGDGVEFTLSDIFEDDDGSFRVDDEHRYVNCLGCGEFFDACDVVFDPRRPSPKGE